jgi:hypothetical protein
MKDYLNYLQDVLGLQQVILENSSNKNANGQTQTSASTPQFWTAEGPVAGSDKKFYELIFLNIVTQQKESLFLPEVQELFGKMKTAMKIHNIQSLELDCTVSDRSQLPSALGKYFESKVLVVFSSFPKDIGELIFKGPGKWIETYSPAYLLEDAGAKKVVWNDLQKVMKELSLL